MISSQGHYVAQEFREVQLVRSEVDSSEFHDCVFVRTSLAESVLRRCRFVGCTFRECDLRLVRVPGSRFTSTRFEKCEMIGVNWSAANWPQAGLADPIGFTRCAISHSTFMGLRLPGLEIKDCVAVDADFREADLSGADFAGTDLSQALFGNTNLSLADLSRARNYHIDPAHNTLKQTRFALPEAMSLLYSMDIVLVDDD